MQQQEPLNIGQLKDMVGDDDDLIRELLDTFLTSGRETMEELSSALNAHDIGEIKMKAHSLKGASANFGASRIQAICSDMESAANQNQIETAPEMFEDLKVKFKDVEEFITEWTAAHS
ncbi:MAG: Hpt domain-containing protein [Planctomycetota bacterium]